MFGRGVGARQWRIVVWRGHWMVPSDRVAAFGGDGGAGAAPPPPRRAEAPPPPRPAMAPPPRVEQKSRIPAQSVICLANRARYLLDVLSN